LSSGSDWNPIVDTTFQTLAKAVPGFDSEFVNGYPEHQWEGKYQLREGDIFVEAGAFWGRYGLVASHRVGESGRVILIEGNPFNVRMIQRVIKHYNLRNVELIDGIVWSSDTTATFCIAGNPAGSRVATPSDKSNFPDDLVEVQAYRLDTLLPRLGVERVDLLAADIEGAEVEMVKGGDMFFTKKKVKNVAIAAYHRPENPGLIMNFLIQRGYRCVSCAPNLPHYGGVVYARDL